MRAKSMEELEKPVFGAIFVNAIFAIFIFFVVVGGLFEPLTKGSALVFVVLPSTLVVMYTMARTVPMYIYKIYAIPLGILIFLSVGQFFTFLGVSAPATNSSVIKNILFFTYGFLAIYILYYIAKKGNKVFRAKYEKRFAAEAAQVAAEASKNKTCPHCAETILAEAKVCKHCGRDI